MKKIAPYLIALLFFIPQVKNSFAQETDWEALKETLIFRVVSSYVEIAKFDNGNSLETLLLEKKPYDAGQISKAALSIPMEVNILNSNKHKKIPFAIGNVYNVEIASTVSGKKGVMSLIVTGTDENPYLMVKEHLIIK